MTLRDKLRIIIFEADTKAGRRFDVSLIVLILLSVLTVMLDSVPQINAEYGQQLYYVEWFFTALFTVEYLIRLWCIEHSWNYAKSFYGIVDLLSVLPTTSVSGCRVPSSSRYVFCRCCGSFAYCAWCVTWVKQAITQALAASRRKIIVFIASVLALMVIFGSLMYVIEGGSNSALPVSPTVSTGPLPR